MVTMPYTGTLSTPNLDRRCPTCHAEGRPTTVTVSARGRIVTYACKLCGYTWNQAQRESPPTLFEALISSFARSPNSLAPERCEDVLEEPLG